MTDRTLLDRERLKASLLRLARHDALGVGLDRRRFDGGTSVWLNGKDLVDGLQSRCLWAGVDSYWTETTEGTVWRLDIDLPYSTVRRWLEADEVRTGRLATWRRALRGGLNIA